MTAVEVKHSVDFSAVDNSFSKQHNVHLLYLWLLVVSIELRNDVLTQHVEVSDLLVVLRVLALQEVNKDCISLSAGHAVFFVVHLEVELQLLIEDVFHFGLVLH